MSRTFHVRECGSLLGAIAIVCGVAAAPLAQTAAPALRAALTDPRPLSRAQAAGVFAASRQALAGKAFRWTTALDDERGSPGATEVLIGADARPRFIRMAMTLEAGTTFGIVNGAPPPPTIRWTIHVVSVTEFTGQPGRACDGTPSTGALIVEYRNEGSGWIASATTRPYLGYPGGIFDILAGTLPAESGEIQEIGNRTARAFTAPWTPPVLPKPRREVITGDPVPNVRRNQVARVAGTQTLWIDVESLLPLRWESMYPEPDDPFATSLAPHTRYSFRYDPALTIARPDAVAPPDCVP